MKWDRIAGNWKQIKGNLKVIWGEFFDDAALIGAGKREQVAGRILEDYGITLSREERQLSTWRKLNS